MNQPIISAANLTRAYNSGGGGATIWAVNGVTLAVADGELLTLTGRSGSGKTTLLNLLSGLDRPTGGAAYFRGRDLSQMPEKELIELRRRQIGFVFQSFGLMPLLSAQENVELPLHLNGVPWRERRRRAHDALESVGLAPPRQTSPLRTIRRRTAARIHRPRPGRPPPGAIRRRTHRRTRHHHRPRHHPNPPGNLRPGHHHHRRHPRPLPGRSRRPTDRNGGRRIEGLN